MRLSCPVQKPAKCSLAKGLHFLLGFFSRFQYLCTAVLFAAHTHDSTPMAKCAFCLLTAKLTGEHLVSDWISRALADTTSHYLMSKIDPATNEIKQWRGPTVNLLSNSVCEKCNTGWMSRIDKAASQTLKGIIKQNSPVSFLRSGLEAIAAFTFKSALVADFESGDRAFFNAHSRRQFKESLQIPQGVYMWFGAIQTHRHIRHGIYRAVYGKPTLHSGDYFQTYIFTWSAESLLLQLVAARWNTVSPLAREKPRISQNASLNETFTPFWPLSGSRLGWPPKFRISHVQLEDVTTRFRGYRFR